jgi:N6-adenosine-specific RNA methylase IME4
MFDGLQPPYGCIVADPPWHFKPHAIATSDKTDRAVTRHYKTMSFAQIEAMPVRDLAGADCHLFFWITGPMLVQGRHLPIFKAWGFKPSAIAFTWVKTRRGKAAAQLRLVSSGELEGELHLGLGLTTRKNAEFCILGRRGNCKRADKTVREIIMAPVREHSRKPDEFRRRVDRYVGPGIRTLELFSRAAWENWDVWGDQAGKFD